jgi:hypothetical protein
VDTTEGDPGTTATTAQDTTTSGTDGPCGNGLLDPGEACDPAGENAEGCSPDCSQGCIALEWLWEGDAQDEVHSRGLAANDDGVSATLLTSGPERWVTVLGEDGTLAWTRPYEGLPYGNPLAFGSNGPLWITGEEHQLVSSSYLRRFALDGTLEIESELLQARAWAAGRALDGGIALAGADPVGPWVGLAGPDGTLQWETPLPDDAWQNSEVYADGVASDGDGNVLVLITVGNLNMWRYLVKLSADGDHLWTQEVGWGSDVFEVGDWPTAMAADGEDGIVLAGGAAGPIGDPMLMVERFDADGTLLWQELPGGWGVAVVGGVDIVTAGDPEDSGRTLLQRLTLDGEPLCRQWVAFAGHDSTAGGHVAEVPGGVNVAGTFEPAAGFVARFSLHD